MFKNTEATSAKRLSFTRVNASPLRVPSWVTGLKSGDSALSQVTSLRPPRLPSGLSEPPPALDPSDLELFDVSKLEAEPELADSMPEPAESARLEEVPVVRRSDTMIEDLIPRAEEEAIAAIREAVEAVAQSRTAVLQESEQQMVELISTIARRVVAREISLDPSVVRDLVREGLSALGDADRVVVRVGAFFAPSIEELKMQLCGSGMVCEVYVDDSLGETGCSIETELGSVDESVERRLTALLDALRGR